MKTRRGGTFRALTLGAALGMALALAGCDAAGVGDAATPAPSEPNASLAQRVPLDELVPLADPGAFEGPSTARLSDAAIEPVADAPEQSLPVAVTSHPRSGDVQVTVEDASRIVAMDLSGSIAATVWGLGFGDALVGRDEAAEFPGVEDLPVVTGASHTVNPEVILALEPTLVITDGSVGPSDAVRQLADAGITVVYVHNEPTFAGAAELARQVAEVLGAPEAGEALATRITADVEQTRAAVARMVPVPADRLRMVFVYLRGDSGIYYMFGSESGADQLIDALGGVDAADDAGIEGMRPLTDEAMIAADPDVVIVMTGGLESVGGVDGLLEARPAIRLTTAGQHRRIVDMEDHQILAFGPHSADVVDALARAIYAPESE